MNKFLIHYGISAVLLLMLFCSAATAQEFRGTITGTVTDPNNAIIPGAAVTVKNVETNIATTIKTNEDGSYTVPFLLPGKYSVTATNDGFKTSIRENIVLNVDDRLTIDFQLSIGSRTEVNVIADEELVERSSVTTGTVITQRQIAELPQPEGAVFTLVTQAPGVNYTGNPQFSGPTANGNLSSFRTNGAGGNQINLDGSPNVGSAAVVAFTPPSDAVQEFKVQTNSFDAQNGFTAGSTVNVALKSGTNRLHGAAYYFNRDKSRTANNFFNNRQGLPRPDRKYFRYGTVLSGPVFVPKLYNGRDRTFFLFAFEKQKDNIAEPTIFLVPTALQRTGNFSEILANTTIYDPATAYNGNSANCGTTGTLNTICRTPFAGNIIPTARLSQVGLNYLALYPLPNLPVLNGQGQFFSNMNLNRPYQSYMGRIDHNINSRNKIFGKYYFAKSQEDRYNWIGKPDSPTRGFEYRVNKGGNIDYTNTLTSNLIFDFRGSYNLYSLRRTPANPISPQSLGFSSAALASFGSATVIPRFDLASFTTATISNAIGSNRSDYNEGRLVPFNLLSIQPTFTQIMGNQTLKYGYDFRKLRERFNSNGFNAGRFLFDGTYTAQASNSSTALKNTYGRDLAALLLGIPTASSNSLIETPTAYDASSKYHAVFLQDDWRINSHLTLNLGLRYEFETGVTEAQNRLVTGFDAYSANPLQTAAIANFNSSLPAGVPTNFSVLGGLQFADDNNRASQRSDRDNLQPRLGISYAINDKTVIRAGYGIFVAPFQIATPLQTGFSNSTLFVPSTNNGLTFTSTLANPFPTGVAAPIGSSQGLTTNIGRAITINSRLRQNAEFNRIVLGFQRELIFGVGLDVNFVYSKGSKLAATKNINSIPVQYLNSGQTFDLNTQTFLTTVVANPFRGLVPSNAAYNGATIARRLLLVPFPEFSDINLTQYDGTSNYRALQIQFIKRFSRDLSLNGSYTFSREHEKDIYLNPQDATPTDTVSLNERPHRFTFSSVYELPVGRGKALGKNMNRFVNAIIGGWQFQGNYEWQTGEPLSFGNVFYSGDPQQLINRLGKKGDQGRRYGVDIPSFDISGFFPAGFVFNNVATIPASIGVGTNTAIGSMNTLRYYPITTGKFRNQRFLNFNAGLTKNFRIMEGVKFQVRFEAINALNDPYFNGINLTPTNLPDLVTPGANNLGKFGFTNGPTRQNPRDFQIGGKFTF